MSPDFLGTVVSWCPLAIESEQLSYIMHQSLIYRSTDHVLAKSLKIDMGPANRGSEDNALAHIKTDVRLVDMSPLQHKTSMGGKVIGLVCGYPIAVTVQRGMKDTFGIFLCVLMRNPIMPVGLVRRVGVYYRIQAGGENKPFLSGFFEPNCLGRGYLDYFSKSWSESVHNTSLYFPDGAMSVEITMKPIRAKVDIPQQA